MTARKPPSAPPPAPSKIDPYHELEPIPQPDVQEKLGKGMGMEIVAGGPDELAALMEREIPRWAALVKKSGAKAD